jgi:hypothetical protein
MPFGRKGSSSHGLDGGMSIEKRAMACAIPLEIGSSRGDNQRAEKGVHTD